MKSKFFPALAVLVGTTIGAGFLGIPYVVAKSGFIIGLVYLVLVAVFMLLIKLYLGEVSLRTKGNHQLTGYAERYIGKWGKILMFLSMFFGIFGALFAYLVAEGNSLSYLIFGNFDFSFMFSLIFWLIMAGLTYIGLKALKKYEKIAMFLVLAIVLLIIILFAGKVQVNNLTYIGSDLFLPFGVILFSFLAFSSMPEVERILSGQEEKMKKVILIGVAIPFVVYLIFTIVAVGVYGTGLKEIATLSFGRLFSILGILTMFTAFFTQSLAIRDMFRFDYNLGRFKGWLLAIGVPLILFLLFYKFANFIVILSLAGVISGGLAGILILLMNKKAKEKGNRKPEYSIKINKWIILVLSLVFILGVILEVLS